MTHLTAVMTSHPVERATDRTLIPKPSTSALSNRERVEARDMLDQDYSYVDHPRFHQADRLAEQQIFDDAPDIPAPDTSWYCRVMEGFDEPRSAHKLSSVLLTTKQEQALFLQFNYCRYRVAALHKQINKRGRMAPTTTRHMLTWQNKAHMLRDQIADTNLALVLAMAKRVRLNERDFSDLVSEGNMALLRAIDKFDASRGFKFSTYGCRAILKSFSRAGMKMTRYRHMFPAEYDPAMERSNFSQINRADHEADCAGEIKEIFFDNRADLTDIEQEVIEHRFAMSKPPRKKRAVPDSRPLTLEQVGRIIGVTKERVRQIQNKALTKIRASLEDDFLR